MKSYEEFKAFYQAELLGDLRQLEAKRKQVMRNTLIAVGIIAVLGLIAAGDCRRSKRW